MATKQELEQFFDRDFPDARHFIIDRVGDKSCQLRLPVKNVELRPGNTISGPTMMGLADAALYVAILGEIGLVPLAVTTNLSINFFHRPLPDADLIADCKILKLGNKLAVGEISLYSENKTEPVAHAVATYAIPPQSKR